MNYKSMLLITLLLPAFCYSQNNEEHISDLEEPVSTVKVTLRKTIKPTPMTPREQYLYALLGAMITWSLTEYAFTSVGFENYSAFLESFCRFIIMHNLIWPTYQNYALDGILIVLMSAKGMSCKKYKHKRLTA
jgi:hypothetical protein